MRGRGFVLLLCSLWITAAFAGMSQLRVMVITEPGTVSDDVDQTSVRFAFYNKSSEGNDRFAGFTIDVMNQVLHVPTSIQST